MASLDLWYLVAISTFLSSRPMIVTSSDTCASIVASQICPRYSCRNKCNKSTEELSVYGAQQMCKCDEQCVMYNDCCDDFRFVCSETFRAGTQKYPQFLTDCYDGIPYVTGKSPMIAHNTETESISSFSTQSTGPTHSSSLTTETTTYSDEKPSDAIKDNTSLGTIGPSTDTTGPIWARLLFDLSHIRIDPQHRLAFSNSYYKKEARLNNSMHTYKPVQEIFGYLQPFYSFNPITNLNIGARLFYNVPEITDSFRHCLRNEVFKCDACNDLISKDMCDPEATYVASEVGDDLELQCSKASSSRPTKSELKDLPKVTVVPLLDQDSSLFWFEDLPWSAAQCRLENKGFTCVLQSCNIDRVLSTDSVNCFIPTRVSITQTSILQFTSPKGYGDVLSSSDGLPEDELPPGLKPTNQSSISQAEISIPVKLCLSLFRLLRSHTMWELKSISLRDGCRFNIKFLTHKVNSGRKVKNSSQGNENNIFGGWSVHHEDDPPFVSDDNQRLHKGRDGNEQSDSEHIESSSFFRTWSKGDPYGMQQAEELIHNHMTLLQGVMEVGALKLCLLREPSEECFEIAHKTRNVCQGLSSRCSSFELILPALGAAKRLSTNLYTQSISAACVLLMLLNDGNPLNFEF